MQLFFKIPVLLDQINCCNINMGVSVAILSLRLLLLEEVAVDDGHLPTSTAPFGLLEIGMLGWSGWKPFGSSSPAEQLV